MTTSSRYLRRSIVLNALFTIEGGSMFVLDVTLAAALGVGARSDSFYAAWSLPLLIGRGAFQSLTNSLIGLFAETEDSSEIYSQVLTVIGGISFVVALLMSTTSRFWFPITLPGAGIETQVLGASLAAVLSWLIALLALAETQRAIYYRLGKNNFPSAARVLGVIASVVLILISARTQNLALTAYGLLFGAAIEMLLGFAGLLSTGMRFRPLWPPADRLRRMVKVVGLPLLGQGVLIGASTLERALASFLGPGTVTAVTYANRIIQVLERFVFRGFVIATIQAYTMNAMQNWRRDTRLLILISIPIMVILVVIPSALITIVFERGRFTAESTQLVALALSTYAFAIPVVALNRIPYALAFAQNKSRELLIYFSIFSLVLIGSEIVLILNGVNLAAFGFSYFLAVSSATIWLYRRGLKGMSVSLGSASEILRLVGVGLISLVGTALLVNLLEGSIPNQTIEIWTTVIVGSVTSLLLTVGAAGLLRLPEFKQLIHLLRRI